MSLRLRAGHMLGGYLIERLLGRGGMGAVYLAEEVVYDSQARPAQFFSERIDPDCVLTRPQDGGYMNLAALCLRDEG